MNNAIRFLGKNVNYCPKCNSKLDGAKAAGNDETVLPSSGDITMCLHCGLFLKFDETLGIKSLSLDDLRIIEKTQPELLTAMVRMIYARYELMSSKGAKHEGTN